MPHQHQWKRDTKRTHHRPPRFFVICECGAKSQAVMKYGYIHVFNTHKPSNPEIVKQVYSIRLNQYDVTAIHNEQAEIKIHDNRLRLQYK
jgi:hypothetical protein